MRRPQIRASWYTAFVVALWAVILPALLVRNDDFVIDWRPWVLVVLAVALLVGATALVFYPARQLAAGGARLMSSRPGPLLATTGPYAHVRNPIDIGATVISVTPWMAMRNEVMWVVPLVAILHYTVGIGLYEDRRLGEAFGAEFNAYRRSVRKWLPALHAWD